MHLEQYLHVNCLSLITITVLVILISTLIPVCSWFYVSQSCYQSPSLIFSQSVNSQMPILCTTLWCQTKAGAEFIRRALGSGLSLASCLRQDHQRVNLRRGECPTLFLTLVLLSLIIVNLWVFPLCTSTLSMKFCFTFFIT